MSYEIGQLDIPDCELLPARAPRASMSMEIGEAVVTHTIFGRARVRIIRKHYSVRRTFLLTVVAVLGAAAAAAWLEWIASQQAGTLQRAPAPPASMQDEPLVLPENVPTPAVPPAANEPAPQTATDAPAISHPANAAESMPAKPARPEPSTADPPLTAPPDTNGFVSIDQTDGTVLRKRPSTKRPAAAAIAVPPLAEESAEAVALLAAPAVKEDASTGSPAATGQAADPGGVQP